MSNNFEKIIHDFVLKIDALSSTLPINAQILSYSNYLILKDFQKFIRKNCDITKEEKSEIHFRLPEKQFTNFKKYDRRLQELKVASEIVPCSFIVTLVSQYDAFIGCIIREILNSKNDILNTIDKKMGYSDLKKFKTINKAIDNIISKEIESVLRERHDDHLKWIETKLNVTLRSDPKLIDDFIEITERRNIFVHCDGIVNEHYLNECNRMGTVLSRKMIGKKIKIDPKYFNHAVGIIKEISVKLAHTVWSKLFPNDQSEVLNSINSICYDMIESGEYSLAINFLSFGLNDFKSKTPQEIQLVLTINKAQSFLWLGKKKEVKEILDKIDFSACKNRFLLAKSVLLEKYDEASKIMEIIGNSNEIRKNDYIEWPLFKEFRKTKIFATSFKKIFGEAYESIQKVEVKRIQDFLKFNE